MRSDIFNVDDVIISSMKLTGHQKTQIGIILLVFSLFVLGVTGVLNIRLLPTPVIDLRSELVLRFLQQASLPPIIFSQDFLVFFLIGCTLSFTLPQISPVKASLLTLVSIAITLYLGLFVEGFGQKIPMEFILLTIMLLFAVHVLLKYFIQTQERQHLISIFSQYVPSEIVRSISQQPESFKLEGESREMTVFFCDIRDFTTISGAMEPTELTRMLNTWFTEITDILQRHGATIDKYIGDSVMAFWGAPVHQPDHAQRAVLAALEIRDLMETLQERFRENNWPELTMGIGINSGVMNVGNMGSRFRVSYTVIGDAVNIAARIEHLTRKYDVPLIVSESTRMAVTGVVFKKLDQVTLKGKEETIKIYEPVCVRNASL